MHLFIKNNESSKKHIKSDLLHLVSVNVMEPTMVKAILMDDQHQMSEKWREIAKVPGVI